MKFEDSSMQQYFDSLPAFVQENILQSGVAPNTLVQLKDCAQNFLNEKEK